MLAAGNFPQHRTVCEFRRRHLAEFSELFVGVVQVAREMGLARFGKLSVDGTKVRANASKRKAMSYERMGKEAARLQAEIEALLTKAGMVDAEEDERWGEDLRGDELPEDCRAARPGDCGPAQARAPRSSVAPALRRLQTRFGCLDRRQALLPALQLGPLPAGRQLVGGRLELPGGEFLQQHRILEPDAALVVPGEQVAQHLAARGLVGFDADEPGDGGRSRHPLLGEQPLHLPGGRAVTLC